MKLITTFVALCSLLSVSFTAKTPCKRDACYNAIAVQNRNNPNVASRRNDCSRALKKVIDDDVTRTASTTTTTVTSYTTTTMLTISVASIINKREEQPTPLAQVYSRDLIDNEVNLLEERDTIIVQGPFPKYAAACRAIQSYASACLCFGAQPLSKEAITITATQTLTLLTSTSTTYTATTTIGPCSPATSCGSNFQTGGCGGDNSNCACFQTDMGNRCAFNLVPNMACDTTEECGRGAICAIGGCNQGAGKRGFCYFQSDQCLPTADPERLFRRRME